MRRELDRQIEEKEKSKADAYAEFLKEKELVDKVQLTIPQLMISTLANF